MVRMLLKEKCEIVAYDPAAMEKARLEFEPGTVAFANSGYEAASDADALLILTDLDEFAALDLERLRHELRHPIVVDGRNLYSLEEMQRYGFSYVSVGRPEITSRPAKLAGTLGTILPKTDVAPKDVEAA